MANSYFDHVGILLDKEHCLQIGPPITQIIPSYFFLVMNRKPFVLRLPPDIKNEFLQNARNLLGKSYNYGKAMNTWISLVFYEKMNLPLRFNDTNPDRLICTDGVFSAHPHINELRKKYNNTLDYDKIGSHSLNDFLVLAEKGEFLVVKLPFPLNSIAMHEGKNYCIIARKLLQKESLFSSIVNLNNIISTGRLWASTKKKRYINAYRLMFAIAQAMKMMRIQGVELFQLISFVWPRL